MKRLSSTVLMLITFIVVISLFNYLISGMLSSGQNLVANIIIGFTIGVTFGLLTEATPKNHGSR